MLNFRAAPPECGVLRVSLAAACVAACSDSFSPADAMAPDGGGTRDSRADVQADVRSDVRADVRADAPIDSGTPEASGDAPTGDASPSDAPGPESATDSPTGSTYRATILADRPLVYWRMGVKTGLSVPDEVGDNDLVLQGTGHVLGTPGAIAGDRDSAIGFDGVGSFAIATDPRALDFADGAAFTLECWARRAASGGEYFQHILGNIQGSVPSRNGYVLYIVPNPGPGEIATTALEYDQPNADTGIFGPLIAPVTWTHLAGVFDGHTLSLFVDGTIAGPKEIGGFIGPRSSLFAVGRSSGETRRYFAGAIDEIAIYPRALTVAQISKHIAAGRNP